MLRRQIVLDLSVATGMWLSSFGSCDVTSILPELMAHTRMSGSYADNDS